MQCNNTCAHMRLQQYSYETIPSVLGQCHTGNNTRASRVTKQLQSEYTGQVVGLWVDVCPLTMERVKLLVCAPAAAYPDA
jgi:hypothetical protein